MKEEWKIWIKGVPGRGNEVIKALTDLEGKENGDFKGDNNDYIYYITHTGEIDNEYIYTEKAKIIMDNYREIKFSEKWKNGDILFSKANNEFAVFEVEHINSNKFFSYLATCYAGYLTYQDIPKKDFRLATKSEVAQFHERLHAINKDWDAEKKQLVDWKWKPAVGDRCWMVTSNGKVNMFLWFGDKTNMKLLDFGNCFHTKEEAKIAGKKIKHLLKEE